MEEKYTTSPWLIDPRDKPKVFSLAGFFQNEHVSEKEMERTKTDIGKKIRDLGGTLLDSDCWDDSITHVVAYVDTRKEGMSEKVNLTALLSRMLKVTFLISEYYKNARKSETVH